MNNRPGRIATSWQLLQSSLSFLANNKDLIMIPVMSLIVSGLLFLAFFASGLKQIIQQQMNQHHALMPLIIFAVLYMLFCFAITFFNAVLIATAARRLQGKRFSITQGFAETWQHWPALLGWTLISSIVGQIIHMLESSNNIFEEIVAAIIGVSWALCSFFVLPVLILENVGPIQAFNNSRKKFANNWRKVFSINIFFMLLFVVIIALMFALIKLSSSSLVFIELLIIAFVGYIFLMTLAKALNAIVKSALYLYIMKEINSSYFEDSLLDRAIVAKKRRFG